MRVKREGSADVRRAITSRFSRLARTQTKPAWSTTEPVMEIDRTALGDSLLLRFAGTAWGWPTPKEFRQGRASLRSDLESFEAPQVLDLSHPG